MIGHRVYTLMDIFAGCGGMTRGFKDSTRFVPILAVEADPDAAATYRLNFGDHIAATVGGDPQRIEEITEFPKVDVVIGGPPCQAFSLLNRHGVGHHRRALWREYLRAVVESEALAFVMENVPQLISSDELRLFTRHAVELGFTVKTQVLNAADYGVPQRRRRAIVVGAREIEFEWPERTHADPSSVEFGRRPWRTFREAVHGLEMKPDGRNWHNGRNPRPETVTRYRAVPLDGGNRFQMQANLDKQGLHELVPPCFRRKPTGTTDVFGRLSWDRPAVTIRTEFYKPEKGRYLHPQEHRPITVREAARCMSFSDDFIFPSRQSMTSVARQIGNAVPPLLAHRLADALAVALDSTQTRAIVRSAA